MQHTSLNALLALALLSAGGAPQDPPSGLRPDAPRRSSQAIELTLGERLQGAWQLVGVSYKNIPQTNSSIAGYMLVLPDYMSIEMHLMMRSEYLQKDERPFFQSGTHRWRITGQGRLETSSLIGNSNINDWEAWQLEPPGSKRTFHMTLNGAALVLERPGESSMTFRKLPQLPYPGRTLEFREQQREQEAAEKKQAADDDASGG